MNTTYTPEQTAILATLDAAISTLARPTATRRVSDDDLAEALASLKASGHANALKAIDAVDLEGVR